MAKYLVKKKENFTLLAFAEQTNRTNPVVASTDDDDDDDDDDDNGKSTIANRNTLLQSQSHYRYFVWSRKLIPVFC
jgi:hypothetical protein